MKVPFKERSISTAVVIPSVIIVAALAVLQYRWSSRISEATAVRLADSLQMSMMNWQKDFFGYFSEIGLALRIDPGEDTPGDVSQYVRRFAGWKAAAKYPDLVSNVYLFRSDAAAQPPARSNAARPPAKSDAAARPPALRLNLQSRTFEPADLPAKFAARSQDLRNASAEFLRSRASRQPYGLFEIGDPSTGWLFDPGIPALFHPVVLGSAADWIAIELSRREIQSRMFPDLSRTYFQGTDGLDYLIAVISGDPSGHVLYSSDPGFGDPPPADADGTIDLFGRVRDPSAGSPVHVFHAPSNDKGPDASVKISWFPFLRETANSMDWRLVVRHRRGGALGAFVGEMRRRDLAIGFGVLLVLVINMAMLIVTSHRAQRLAQLQMDFVTAVSHELRTPLTVIMSGADNICSGVVETRQQMAQYGSVIGKQAKHLFDLVERILLFAATRQGRLRYNLLPLQVGEVIDAALASTAGLIEAAHFTVQCNIEAGLPPVVGDAAALSQCLQNLIANAIKYSGEQRWIGIRAASYGHGLAENQVQISVSDRGMGIAETDLPHIFEPFYRSSSVKAAQIQGTGLGLPLARSIAEAMNGRLAVSSSPGSGSTFTLYLTCAERSVRSGEPEVQDVLRG